MRRVKNLKLIVLLTCFVLLFSYSAMVSQDIFNYLTTAKTVFKYHENPYIVMPIEFKGDTNLLFTHAANKIALYGPFWIVLSALPYYLSFGNFILSFLNFKLLVIVFYLGTLFLIKKFTKSEYSTALFALNPLIIFEILVGNHNDIVMMFFALLSFFFLMRKNIVFAIFSLIFSILIKYSTIFLIPVFLLVLFKTLKNQDIDWSRIFSYSAYSMLIIFLLSAFREEIYPWYAVWFLTFTSLTAKNKLLFYLSFAFSFGLLFRHVPFMLLGTHFGPTPVIKAFVTFIPVGLILVYGYIKKIYR